MTTLGGKGAKARERYTFLEILVQIQIRAFALY